MTKICIFDDEKLTRQKFKGKIESVGLSFDVEVFKKGEFEDILEGIEDRQRSFRKTGKWEHDQSNQLDDVDVLIVDYDLFDFHYSLNADKIAYSARCFTTCGPIVLANRVSHNPFDLTLRSQSHSFADLEIGQDQLSSAALWGNDSADFTPWYWPILPRYAETFEKCVRDVKRSLQAGETIRDMLGFPEESWEWLPRNVRQFLGDEHLEEFLMVNSYGLDPKDQAEVKGQDGRIVDIETYARIAAARISKWLAYSVLPQLDILVDAPHLGARLPSLLQGNRDNIGIWNSTAKRHVAEVPNFDMKVLEPFQLKKSHWLPRPVWFWRDVINCNDIEDVREPWNITAPDWVFCEDTSAFHPEEECRPFKAEVVSPFASRYVRYIEGVNYFPKQRFAL
jgi:hypothetical protein